METVVKSYIMSELGKIIDRKIKTDAEGKEYILHMGMKAFLKDLPDREHGRFILKVKQVDYYQDK